MCFLSASLIEALHVQLPLDLRRTMASSILLVGGASMLPGFAARLEQELVRTLQSKHQIAPISPRKLRRTHKTRFHPISNLHADVAVLNNPTPGQHPRSGSASAFSPHLLPWIGASLAVALKTSGEEITRDQWDDRPSLKKSASSKSSPTSFQMPDWTIRHVRTLTTVS
jgi:actin-related protein 10